MANEQNLIPQNKRAKSEQRQIAKMGGYASGESRRRNKAVKDIIQHILNSNLSENETAKLFKQFNGLETDEASYKAALVIKQLEKALKGDTTSFKAILDYGGETPINNVNIETKLPVLNIEVTDNKELEKEFEKYDK